MNGRAKVTWIMLCAISHSGMVHARVLEAYIHFSLMYTEYHTFPALHTKDLINGDGDPNTPFKLVTSMKSAISY